MPYTANQKVALTIGNVPDTLAGVQGPAYAQENLAIRKAFRLGGVRTLSIGGDVFNIFNRVGRGNPVTDINNQNFGRILTYKYSPRQAQIRLTLNF